MLYVFTYRCGALSGNGCGTVVTIRSSRLPDHPNGFKCLICGTGRCWKVAQEPQALPRGKLLSRRSVF